MAKKSRAARYELAMLRVGKAQEEFETLRDELQSWLDNMPENLQESSKAERLQEAIDALDADIDATEEIVSTEIEFPGAFG